MSDSAWEATVHAHFDGALDDDGAARLSARIASDPEAAAAFARLAFLHDALEREFSVASEEARCDAARVRRVTAIRRTIGRSAALVASLALVAGLAWVALLSSRAASASEIVARLVAASRSGDRTYLLREASDAGRAAGAAAPRRGKRPAPPVDGAILFVRAPDSHVLLRRGPAGGDVASGSDGTRAWIVPDEGPVRVSRDPRRFAGTVPGLPTGVVFADPADGLGDLGSQYELQVSVAGETGRISGTRRPDARGGPKRIEIAYDVATSRILSMRLDQLPQARGGPRSVVFELIDDGPLPSDFFAHQSHHDPSRPVIEDD